MRFERVAPDRVRMDGEWFSGGSVHESQIHTENGYEERLNRVSSLSIATKLERMAYRRNNQITPVYA